jgi:hypothetical protein
MAHPRLEAFFTGVVDELRGAYRKSEGAPAPCMGSLRERGIRRAIEHSLPNIATIYEGEVIDQFGAQSGQLDGIVVHSTGAALATAADDTRVVLAEGVLAAIESKSNLMTQWAEVERTWEMLRKLRRWEGTPEGVLINGGRPHPSEAAISLIAIGRVGWAKDVTIVDHAEALFKSFDADHPPATMVVQLDPPGYGLVYWESDGRTVRKVGKVFDEKDRWRAVANLWVTLTDYANRLAFVKPGWARYLS